MQISQEELCGIVQVVELAFAKGQRRPLRRTQTYLPGRTGAAMDAHHELRVEDVERESVGGSVQEVELGGLAALASAAGRGGSQLTTFEPSLMHDFTGALIPKQEYTRMEILAIQNVLSRDYHFLKWHLVEELELQERELHSVAFKSTFADSVRQLMEQEASKKLGL